MLKQKRILLLGIAMVSLSVYYALHIHARAKPNILFIVGDDVGWNDVGWHAGLAKTPHMDKLVQEGLELDAHYVYPSCTPTRTALMTGRYPGRFGPNALDPSNLRSMPLGTITIASALKSLGYNTYISGKWGMGSRFEWGPLHYGFDHAYGTLSPAADPWTHLYRPGAYENTWNRDGTVISEQGNATDLVAAEAVSRIKEKQQPWFLYVPFHAVHTPVDAPQKYKKLYDGVVFDKNPAKQDSRLRLVAEMSQLDEKIGDLVAALEQTGQRENTIIIFTSDNGGNPVAENPYIGRVPPSPLNSSNAPLRGEKSTVYDGGIRTSAFVNWPSELKPKKYTHMMHAVDWFPTIAAITGYNGEDLNWDGINQWPMLTGLIRQEPKRDIYTVMGNGEAALRRGDWKLVSLSNNRRELYNLREDPSETKNLIEEQPEIAAGLQKLLERQRAQDLPTMPADLINYPYQ